MQGLYTEEDMKQTLYFKSECERLGIDLMKLNEEDSLYTKEEFKAMSILCRGKRLPLRLEKSLLAAKEYDEEVFKRFCDAYPDLIRYLEEYNEGRTVLDLLKDDQLG